MQLDFSNNYEISSDDIELSINLRGASLIRNSIEKSLTIVSNLKVKILYNFDDEDSNKIGFKKISPDSKLREDFIALKNAISKSRFKV